MQNLVKRSQEGSRDLLLKFGTPPYLGNGCSSKRQIWQADLSPKLGQRVSEKGHVTYSWNFGNLSTSRERLEIETSNLPRRFINEDTNERNAKLGQRGLGRGYVTYFYNFGTPSISRERLEIETLNLASILITMGTNERNAKLGQRGSERGHVTHFWNFETPVHISGTVGARNVKFGMQIHH